MLVLNVYLWLGSWLDTLRIYFELFFFHHDFVGIEQLEIRCLSLRHRLYVGFYVTCSTGVSLPHAPSFEFFSKSSHHRTRCRSLPFVSSYFSVDFSWTKDVITTITFLFLKQSVNDSLYHLIEE